MTTAPFSATSFLSWRKRAGVRAVPTGSHSSHFLRPLSEELDLEAQGLPPGSWLSGCAAVAVE